MDDFLFPPGTPEDFKEQFTAMIDKQRMAAEDYQHSASGLVDGFNEEQLTAFKEMMHYIAVSGKGSGRAIPAYYEGIATGFLHVKYNVCLGCGKNHDREMQAAMEDSLERFKAGDPNPYKASPPEKDLDLIVTDLDPDLQVGQNGELSTAQLLNMETYNLDDLREEGSNILVGFICKKCGLRYVSIEDRMLKPVDDCSGCHSKQRWG